MDTVAKETDMENLILAFNVVMPLFLTIAIGYGLKVLKFYDKPALDVMNKLCFKVFLPLMLFENVYKTDLAGVFNGKILVFSVISVFVMFVILMLLIPRVEKDNARRGVLIQAMFRSNFVLFGLPVVISLCGEEASGVTALMIAVVVPMYNALSVVALETFRGGKPSLKKIGRGVITNPLIIASALGILLFFTGVKLPYAVDKTIADLGKIATPLALVVLGGSFDFSKIRGYARQLLIGVGGKLVIGPALFLPNGVALGFRDVELTSLMIMFGAPTAVSSFTMAQQMDGDSELAGQLVVFSSAFSILTIFIWIFILKQLNLM